MEEEDDDDGKNTRCGKTENHNRKYIRLATARLREEKQERSLATAATLSRIQWVTLPSNSQSGTESLKALGSYRLAKSEKHQHHHHTFGHAHRCRCRRHRHSRRRLL